MKACFRTKIQWSNKGTMPHVFEESKYTAVMNAVINEVIYQIGQDA